MDRRAILIEASTIRGHDDLPGARADVASYRDYLRSDFGGAWEDSEILTLRHPSKSDLQNAIRIARLYDYAFVSFSGHGYHAVGKGINETRLHINSDEEVSVNSLNPGNNYSLIVADACRKVTNVDADAQMRAFAMALNQAEAKVRPNRARCRDLFYTSLKNAEYGSIYFYSCGLNEAAGDVPSFSSKLVEVGETWGEKGTAGILQSNAAFRGAAAAITSINPRQNPQSEAGRRTVHFPWGVLAY